MNHLSFKSILTIALICISATVWSGDKHAAHMRLGFDIPRLNRVDDMAREYVDAGLLPAAMYAIVRKDGVVHTSIVGDYREDQIFRIYSMTKPITAVAALILLEEGKLLLTDPVARYLPEFSSPQVYLEDGSLAPAKRPITIRHLLTHTAGLSYSGYPSHVSRRYAEAKLWEAESLADFSEQVARLPLVAQPGEFWQYSVGLDILGRVIEVASGQPFDAFMRSRLFEPLGMVDTGFTLPSKDLKRLAPIYRYKEGGMDPAPAESVREYLHPNFPAGGGGLVSTLKDYMRFARMLLNAGELDDVKILSRKSVEMMTADHLLAMNPELTVNEAWLGRTENRSGSVDLGFGFGLGGAVIRNASANAVPGSKGTYGWGGNSNVYFFLDRHEDVSGIFFTQLQPSGVYPIRSRFRAGVYQALE